MTRIGIILGRPPGRRGEAVARWVHEIAPSATTRSSSRRLLDYKPRTSTRSCRVDGQYTQPHTLRWAARSPRSALRDGDAGVQHPPPAR